MQVHTCRVGKVVIERAQLDRRSKNSIIEFWIAKIDHDLSLALKLR